MGTSDRHEEVLGVKERQTTTTDAKEWQEVLRCHKEAQAERAKASTAKARATLQRLNDDAPRLEAEMAERHERRMMFPETLQPNEPSFHSNPREASVSHEAVGTPTVMNAAKRQVREMHEAQRPTLDPATQALWDNWCDARIMLVLEEYHNEKICKENYEHDKRINDDLKNHVEAIRKLRTESEQMRKEFADEIAKLKKEFTAKIVKMRKETSTCSANIIDLPQIPLKKA
jgi:hypothetical protein